MKIAHLADTHIRNYKYHREYRAVFDQIYDRLKKEKVDYIVHCGDLAHTKTQLSPEYFDLATSFLKNLADIAPTYIILGNHDGNLKNEHRQDAITPIVNALAHPQLHLLKDAGETVVDNIIFNVLSVFDEENWVKPSSDEHINIALYHGSVSGVKTDTGWVMTHGDHPIEIFEGHDYVFLGDIHKTNQILDDEGKVRYPGSTVQQNFGETNDKGFLLWDIQDKDSFTCEHIAIPNPRPFVTVILTPSGRMPKNLKIQKGARLRLVSKNNVSVEAMHKAMEIARHRFKPESVTFLNRSAGQRGDIEKYAKDILQEALRDPETREKLMKEYLKDYDVTDDLLDKVMELDKKYSTIVEEKEEIARNVNWRVHNLEWDNLFNYGEGNKLNFNKLSGVVGVFGKNYSGKSSIIDSLLYTVFNTTSKNERKNYNVVNQQKTFAASAVDIMVGDTKYTINRDVAKYVKRLKGVETSEAKVNLDFYKESPHSGEIVSLNGLTRNETDANIRRVFGTIDDFLNTSMSSQTDSLSFIREGSTKRKEIIAKFLDLEVFERKFKLAKEDSSDFKGAVRRMSERNFEQEIKDAKEELFQGEKKLILLESRCRKMKERLIESQGNVAQAAKKIETVPAEVINIADVRSTIRKAMVDLAAEQKFLEKSKEDLRSQKSLVVKVTGLLTNYDIDGLKVDEQTAIDLWSKVTALKDKLIRIEEKATSLSDPEFLRGCKCLREAEEALKQKPDVEKEVNTFISEHQNLDAVKIAKMIEQHGSLQKKKDDTGRGIVRTELAIAKAENNINSLAAKLKTLKTKETSYEENKEAIENLERLMTDRDEEQQKADKTEKRLDACADEHLTLNRQIGSLEQKVENIEAQQLEAESLRREYAAYELFMRCMHSNGIAYDIIKKRLPIINQEIAKVLTNLTDFEVFFEEAGNKLEISIKHPKHDPRPLSMASGAEKTMASMAIRLALLQISNLPKSDIMILDEPGTALDETHLQAFTQMLELLKTQFKTILLVSHLDSLKDVADITIDIAKKDGFAFVNQ